MGRRQRPSALQRKLCAAASSLLREVDERYRLAGYGCEQSTRCCRFGLTARQPHVTAVELALILAARARAGGPLPPSRRALARTDDAEAEAICPLLSLHGHCSIYESRPLGCRTHWCQQAHYLEPVRHGEVLGWVRRLQQLAAEYTSGGDQGRPLVKALATSRKS